VTHTPAEWAQMVSLAVAVYAAGSVPVLLYGTTPPQWFVYTARDLDRAIAAVCHALAPHATAVRHALYGVRDAARDAAALVLLLTTRPKGAMTA
jgi:hypothetical protein